MRMFGTDLPEQPEFDNCQLSTCLELRLQQLLEEIWEVLNYSEEKRNHFYLQMAQRKDAP